MVQALVLFVESITSTILRKGRRLWQGQAAEGGERTHSSAEGSDRCGANLRGSLHRPGLDKVAVDKTSFISSCCCSMGEEVAGGRLTDSGAER